MHAFTEITSLILKHGSRTGPNDFEIPLDDDVTVECTATSVQPKPEFRWYLGEFPLDTRQRLTGGITTPNVSFYLCIVRFTSFIGIYVCF